MDREMIEARLHVMRNTDATWAEEYTEDVTALLAEIDRLTAEIHRQNEYLHRGVPGTPEESPAGAESAAG